MQLDAWDVRHLLLSIAQMPRSDRDRADLDAVMRRVVAALEAQPMPSLHALPTAWTRGAFLEAVPCWAFETNSWLYAPGGAGGDCVVVDVPPSCGALVERIAAAELRVRAVVLTHGHLDHAGGTGELLEAVGPVPVYVHARDADLLRDEVGAGGEYGRVVHVTAVDHEVVQAVDDGDEIAIGDLALQVLHVPGHTGGSICLYTPRVPHPLLFTGDHLFATGAGRTDLGGGSDPQLHASMALRVAPLPDDTVLCPGHGAATTLAAARRVNPVLHRARESA